MLELVEMFHSLAVAKRCGGFFSILVDGEFFYRGIIHMHGGELRRNLRMEVCDCMHVCCFHKGMDQYPFSISKSIYLEIQRNITITTIMLKVLEKGADKRWLSH